MFAFFYLNYFNLPPSNLHTTELQSVINPLALAYIFRLKDKIQRGFATRERDYYKIMALVLPQLFRLDYNWCIAPEFVLPGDYRPDYLVSIIITNYNDIYYGYSIDRLLAEVKNRGAVSGWSLMKDQLWNQADAAKNNDGRFWVVAQIGFEICFFRFDVTSYPSFSDYYTNFKVLNLRNLSEGDLEYLNIKYITEVTDGIKSIRIIKWR